MKHDEDLLEQLYWEFDQARKCGGGERLIFKSKLRAYAVQCAQLNQERRSAFIPEFMQDAGSVEFNEIPDKELIDKWVNNDK